MRRVHHRTEQIGLRLIHHLAPAVTAALADLQRQQSQCDGWPAKGDSSGRGTSDTSTTESAALQASAYDGRSEEINDTIESIEISVGHLAKLVIGIDHTPAAGEAKRCSDGQVGRDSKFWSDNEGCRDLPDKTGMCTKHYWQYRRYRMAHGLDTSRDFEPG